MKMFRNALAAIASLCLAASPALADVAIKDGTGASVTMGATACKSGAQCYNMDTIVQGAATDIGASVTANTSTTLASANTSRRGFAIQNQTAGACYLSGLATATLDYHSMLIPAGALYLSSDSHVGTGALSIICAQAGGVYGRQW